MGENNDIAHELALLHMLSGADYARQVERIARRSEFHPIDSKCDVYSVGGEQSEDYENLLRAADNTQNCHRQEFHHNLLPPLL
jgi:predicted ATPase